MNFKATTVIIALLVFQTTFATRPDPDHAPEPAPNSEHSNDDANGGWGFDRFFGPGSGYADFGFGSGYANGGVVRPTMVCKEKGPCYGKKLSCPAKCFKSFSQAGKGYGYGGGGGGCTVDCHKKCVAYC